MKSLTIRKTQESDLDSIVSIESQSENSGFILTNTKKEHLAMLQDKNIDHLVLTLAEVGKKIAGFIILAGLNDRNKSIEFRRIVIIEKGKGLGRLAIRKIKEYVFEKKKCNRLWLDVLESNSRARHLYLSEGFVEEGKLREAIMTDGGSASLIVMSILKNEYLTNK